MIPTTDLLATELENKTLHTLTVAKVDELAERINSGELSPTGAAEALHQFTINPVGEITPRHKELFEQKLREELVQSAISQAFSRPPTKIDLMNIRRVYPD